MAVALRLVPDPSPSFPVAGPADVPLRRAPVAVFRDRVRSRVGPVGGRLSADRRTLIQTQYPADSSHGPCAHGVGKNDRRPDQPGAMLQ